MKIEANQILLMLIKKSLSICSNIHNNPQGSTNKANRIIYGSEFSSVSGIEATVAINVHQLEIIIRRTWHVFSDFKVWGAGGFEISHPGFNRHEFVSLILLLLLK